MNKVIIVFLIAIGLISCASTQPPPVKQVIYKTTPLTLPSKPKLPTWKAADMECLSIEMKQKILERDRTRKAYSEDLEVIIKTTQH